MVGHISGSELQKKAQALFKSLDYRCQRIVFAESCTCGLLAVTLGRVPGVSEVLCGAAVTYRNATKAGWINVDEGILEDPNIGPVSEQVARMMSEGVLAITPEASIAVSVTGDLGPLASPETDGIAFVGLSSRSEEVTTKVKKIDLKTEIECADDNLELRYLRQNRLVFDIFEWVISELDR